MRTGPHRPCLSRGVTAPQPLGYDPAFLPGGPPAPLPVVAPGVEVVELAYTHFTVLLRPDRRMAAATAVNVDGSALRELDRDDEVWLPDPRVAVTAQTGDPLYARNDLDRGHLVRRRDPVWGTPREAARANTETFLFPNCAPQAAQFNQGKELWLGLEDYLLGRASAAGQRLTVLTGPVLTDDDPVYREVALPLRFWKVAAWTQGGALAATAYLLDQADLVERIVRPGVRKDLVGAFRTFQVPVSEVEAATGLSFGPLAAADRLPARRELHALTDMALLPLVA